MIAYLGANMKKTHINILDSLIQQIACTRLSYLSYKQAECGHHLIGRRDLLHRWNIENIVPLTLKEHNKVHTGEIKLDVKKPTNNLMFKDYLLLNGWTDEDFFKIKKKELEDVLNA